MTKIGVLEKTFFLVSDEDLSHPAEDDITLDKSDIIDESFLDEDVDEEIVHEEASDFNGERNKVVFYIIGVLALLSIVIVIGIKRKKKKDL